MKTHALEQQLKDEADANFTFYNEGAGAFLNQDLGEFSPPKVGWGTYDPTDNKIRIRPISQVTRFDRATYDRLRAAGFAWAPKQKLFVAPCWTPQREDLAVELCGELQDEDTTLVDRADERAERFEEYSDKREAEAHRAKDYVAQIADGIPLGQPILVGHHSENRARKDAERIENGMRKAVSLWETSKYWTRRAAGAKAHAKYKELPGVRARRIKTIEADKRKKERALDSYETMLKLWKTEPLTREVALHAAGLSHTSHCFTLAMYPREKPVSQYEGPMGLWSALDDGIVTHEQARDLAVSGLNASITSAKRWIIHYEMRLIYENCMLEESGFVAEPRPKSLKETLPLLNYRAESISYDNPYHRGEVMTVPQVGMTKAEYAKIYKDYKGTAIVERSHKVRTAIDRTAKPGERGLVAVFLTDSKVHEKPAPAPPAEPQLPRPRPTRVYKAPERTEFDDIKDSLKAGVRVVSAPQLFPTPHWLANRMVELLDVALGHRVLEPSAGTGILLDVLLAKHPDMAPYAVEINHKLASDLRLRGYQCDAGDFLELAPSLGHFDRIIANPPFGNGADIEHILAALSLLKPGGRLVAICADGPRQNEQLKPLAETWEELPERTFASQGTNVRTALAVFVVK